jgi:para-aminobenzoate synthetase component 1
LTRKSASFPLTDLNNFKSKLLNFGERFSNFCFLDNHGYSFDKSYECLAAIGSVRSIVSDKKNSLRELHEFSQTSCDWIFGHLSYDLKNQVESLTSSHPDQIRFPDFVFFVPEIVIILSEKKVEISSLAAGEPKDIFDHIVSFRKEIFHAEKPVIKARFSKQEFINNVQRLQEHIQKGDAYEITFCQEFYAENAVMDPVSVFENINELSPNPFAAFYKFEDKYLLSASPERFLKRSGNKIISQPIKGTAKRKTGNDKAEIEALESDEKERAENTMIVDLVRNDLAKICCEGSVAVKEFLKIYSFPHVHQMISTIEGKLKESVSFSEIIAATFPMGSMTGAPKKSAMELIERYEKSKRGVFSGSVGYIDPQGNFDFNVVIRSILYNESKKYVSIPVGAAITAKSVAEKEFEECLLKIEAIRKALEE